jgi:hypothetical protein
MYSTKVFEFSRTSISGTALSGSKPSSGRFYLRSDSFHRQKVQRLAEIFRKLDLYAVPFPSRLSISDYNVSKTTPVSSHLFEFTDQVLRHFK